MHTYISRLPANTKPNPQLNNHTATLGRVWELADADRDNRLSAPEFAVAMHLIVCASKRGLPLPPTLPPSLRQSLAVPPTSPSTTIPSPGGAPGAPPAATARPLSTSTAAPPSPSTGPGPLPPSPGLAATIKPAPSLSASATTLGASSLGVSASSSKDAAGPEAGVANEVVQKMKMERVALAATVEAAQADTKRVQEGLGKALQEIASLQAELASLRKARVVLCYGGADCGPAV